MKMIDFIRDKYYKVKRFMDNIYYFFKLTIPSYFIRGKKGWAKSDTWELDTYLAKVISDSILCLSQNPNGHPSEFNNIEEWQKILKTISDTFNTAIKIRYELMYIPSEEFTTKTYNKVKKQFKSCQHIHVMTKQEVLKYEEGWKLFQKYFNHLWD